MMGRITQTMMTSQMMRNLNNNLSAMSYYQDQTANGKKINKPSDDPVGINYALMDK
jgi:flagellar hook-associated protein 3 FlgL